MRQKIFSVHRFDSFLKPHSIHNINHSINIPSTFIYNKAAIYKDTIMAQAAVILRRAHEKERRRREQEHVIDHSVTINQNSDSSLSGAGRNSSPDTFYLNKKIETGCSLNQSPDKEVWVGFLLCRVFFMGTIYNKHIKFAPEIGLSLFSVYLFVICYCPHFAKYFKLKNNSS